MPSVDLPERDQQRLDRLQLEVEARVEGAQQRVRQALAVQPERFKSIFNGLRPKIAIFLAVSELSSLK